MRLCVALCILLALSAAAMAASAPQSPRVGNVETLAWQGWSSNPSVIWYDDFNGPSSGLSRYLEYDTDGGDFAPVTTEALGGSGQSMRAVFQAGEVGAGGLKLVFGRNPMDYRGVAVRPAEDFRDLYWRVYVKHQDGWTGDPAKMSRATAFAASDWSQAMIAHVWGGSSTPLVIDPARGVNSSSQVVTHGYNDFANLSWLGYQSGTYPLFATAESGRWVSVEAHVKLNTPGQSDGLFTLTIDGKLDASRTGLNWVYAWQAYGLNAVFIENYWNAGSPVAQSRFFDDFVVSTAPIGLARSPLNPRVTKTIFHDPDSGDAQGAWQLQIASDLAGADVVWDSGVISGAGGSVIVSAATGAFSGSLAGHRALVADRLYALRVRQRDASGAWSAWAAWDTALQTGDPVAGDATGDGLVNGADLSVWQQNYDPLGLDAGNLFATGDWNFDGRIDGADLALWQQNYRPSLASSALPGDLAAIPEPGAAALLLGGLLALGARRAKNSARREEAATSS
jgi:hypothetical protein